MAICLSELAKRLGATAKWLDSGNDEPERENPDAALRVSELAYPGVARPSSLSFLIGPQVNPGLASKAATAGAVIVAEQHANLVARPFVVAQPLVALAKANHWLTVVKSSYAAGGGRREAGQAVPVGAETENQLPSDSSNSQNLHNQAYIHPSAVLGADVVVGNGSSIGANACLEGEVRVGSFSSIGANVTIKGPVNIGNRVRIDANCTIGSEAFMYVEDCGQWLKVPGFFGVIINDNVDIGAGTTIDQGLVAHTLIDCGVKLDSQVHVGHGVKIGNNSILAGRTTVAGEATIGAGCKIGGASSISEGVRLADKVTLLGMSAVTRSLKLRGEYTSAWPVQLRLDWWKQLATLKRLAKR